MPKLTVIEATKAEVFSDAKLKVVSLPGNYKISFRKFTKTELLHSSKLLS